MKSILTGLVHYWYFIIRYGESVKRELLPKMRQETIAVDDSMIVFESRVVKYTVVAGAWWWPDKIFYTVLMNVNRTVSCGKLERIGTTEYPMFLTNCLVDSRYAHVLARKQFINDISLIIEEPKTTQAHTTEVMESNDKPE